MLISNALFKKSSFVAINVFSSIIVLARSVLFLKYLPDRDLGAIMLFQAIIAIFGLLQIGLFNGGLRIFSVDTFKNEYAKANNTICTYVVSITCIIVFLSLFLHFFFKFDLFIVLISVVIGGFALLKNWFSNLLIARQMLKEVNVLNFCSSIISAALALLIFVFGLTGAIISIGGISISFVVIFFYWQKEYRPSSFRIDKKVVRMILTFGFIPYLTGIATIINGQIDRFFIVERISLEALGQFYLATAFLTIFSMIPASLDSLFAPTAINNYSSRCIKATFKTTKTYLYLLSLYSFIAIAALYFFGEPVINYLFPEKLEQMKYLYIMVPGIIAITLSNPFSFILYVALNYSALLWSNIFSLISYLSILISLVIVSRFTIENVAYAKTFQGIFIFLFYVSIFLLSYKNICKYKYLIRSEGKLELNKT